MRAKLNRKGRVSLPLFTAILALAITFTLSCSNGDDDGGIWYNPSGGNQRCQNGVVENKCGDAGWYKGTTHTCSNGTIMTLEQYYLQNGYKRCGSGWYDPNNENQRCQNGVVEAKCGDAGWYNSTTHTCRSGTVMTDEQYYLQLGYKRCGSGWYDPNNENRRCKNDAIEDKCGDAGWYKIATHTCYSNTIMTYEQYLLKNGLKRCGG
ncbi:MAG: hypothetical protein LBH25_14185 [Fibromonadaceae bacterium]|jgi:hypothetical protein|nr:hypothetical protein [Fibromonadaceae bacterium]